jgi:hypothetical protein
VSPLQVHARGQTSTRNSRVRWQEATGDVAPGGEKAGHPMSRLGSEAGTHRCVLRSPVLPFLLAGVPTANPSEFSAGTEGVTHRRAQRNSPRPTCRLPAHSCSPSSRVSACLFERFLFRVFSAAARQLLGVRHLFGSRHSRRVGGGVLRPSVRVCPVSRPCLCVLCGCFSPLPVSILLRGSNVPLPPSVRPIVHSHELAQTLSLMSTNKISTAAAGQELRTRSSIGKGRLPVLHWPCSPTQLVEEGRWRRWIRGRSGGPRWRQQNRSWPLFPLPQHGEGSLAFQSIKEVK